MRRYSVRTLNGERKLTGGQASYMEAVEIAKQSARELGESVYLWFDDRAPVRVEVQS